ncbi:MAG: transglutaminase-like domain-containing protein [Candidatus Dojkabacteria bacterium]|nr:MAG: transglutaminase-like domain-containing protein [Candidatus Dojkabacteria bacterium]
MIKRLNRTKLISLFALLLLVATNYLPLPRAYASNGTSTDFHVSDSYILVYEEGQEYITVSEKLTIEAFNENYKLPAGTTQQFIIHDFLINSDPAEREFKRNSLTVTDSRGNQLSPQLTEIDAGLQFAITTPYDITTERDYSVTIEFDTHELVNLNGNIINFYIPGIPADTELKTVNKNNGVTFTYDYDAELSIPDSLPQASYVAPREISTTELGGSRVFKLDTEDRLGETGWIQIGTEQFYYFKMVQRTPKTDLLIPPGVNDYTEYLSTNIYQLPLPRTYAETDQEVYFSDLSPKPSRIEIDDEGNVIGYFEVPANQNGEIKIEGYITLKSESQNEIPSVELDAYLESVRNNPALEQYTRSDRYWESDSDEVMGIAAELAKDKTTLSELVRTDYEYIVETFDYSYEKVEGENKRLGAVAALNGSEAVCMEYADALIAILRAQGVAAKAAVGYGNDPTGAENSIGLEEATEQNIAHQWVQVWIPEYGWLSLDPTWGESGRVYIGGNLDHILWYTIGNSSQDYIGTALSSADNISSESFENYDLYLQALPKGSIPEISQLIQVDQLTSQFSADDDAFSSYLKTTPLGKSIVIIAPTCAMLLFTFLIVTVAVRMAKKYLIVHSPR